MRIIPFSFPKGPLFLVFGALLNIKAYGSYELPFLNGPVVSVSILQVLILNVKINDPHH